MTHFTAQKNAHLKFILWIAFACLLALVFAVLFLLPDHVEQSTQKSLQKPSQPTTAVVTDKPAKTDKPQHQSKKPEAEKLLAESLTRLARLENSGIKVWGVEKLETSLSIAEKELKKANSFFDKQQYSLAINHFKSSIDLLDKLEKNKAKRFQRAVNKGQKAFEALDASLAVSQFQIALALEPDNVKIAESLDRAKKLPDVLSNIADGEKFEKADELAKAIKRYEAAVSLDPKYSPAKKLLVNARKKKTERDYQSAVSEALVLLDRQELNGSRRALNRARKIHPNSPEVTDIARRLASARRSTTLRTLQSKAVTFERQEKWSLALSQYKKALRIDNKAAFAHRGVMRAQSFIDLNNSIDRYLSNPNRLYSKEPLQHAMTLIHHTRSLDGGGESLKRKRAKLQKLITLARTPVPVLLKSNRKTHVVIYRLGSVGIFDTKKIELLPGNYTAKGSYPGYRDVIVNFKVLPSAKNLTVTIQSTEQID